MSLFPAMPATLSAEWRVTIHDASQHADREALQALVHSGAVQRVCDTFHEQRADELRSRFPKQTFADADVERLLAEEANGRHEDDLGRWVFYPWSRTLVHVLDEEAFFRLRTDRNHYKITPHEQDALRGKTIGIVGLSVGLSVAVTLALEGIGGRLRLADFDTLGLSNLNRLRAGVADLGVNKAILAARQLLELNPYLQLDVFTEGITTTNLDAFLHGDKPLDLLVEECDDFATKLRLREECAKRRIPVIMDTSDRGLLDVERFDREPGRRPFHGLLGETRADELGTLTMPEKVSLALRILDPARMSTAGCASLLEIRETISTWPQLGSGVTLGGALVADAARRLLLNQFTESGRYYVDLEAIVADGTSVAIPTRKPLFTELPETGLSIPAVPMPSSAPLSNAEAEYLVAHAALAPSGGNAQPWHFRHQGATLEAMVVGDRSTAMVDFRHHASYLALGATATNITLAAEMLGLQTSFDFLPDAAHPELAYRATFTPFTGELSGLGKFVAQRCTYRRMEKRQLLAETHIAALKAEAKAAGGTLLLHTDALTMAALGDMIGQGDRLRFFSEVMHRELVSELRWTADEALRTRDGIDLPSLEVSAVDQAVLNVLGSWPNIAKVRSFGGGEGLTQMAKKAVQAASAVGLLRFPGRGPLAFLRGGMALQRLWLRVTALGLALQPLSILPYLFNRLEHGGEGFTPTEQAELLGLRRVFQQHFGTDTNAEEVLLFRLTHAHGPTHRSLRRPVAEILRHD